MRWARHIAHIVYNILVRKPEGKTLPGRHWRSWECNIRVDLREKGWNVWIGFIRLRTGTSGGVL